MGVEGVAQAVAEEVDAEHGEGDGEAGPADAGRGEGEGEGEERHAVVEQAAPGGEVGGEAEDAEGALGDDRLGDVEDDGDHDRALLDGNMARVIERVFEPRRLVDIRYDSRLQALARIMVRSSDPARVNWAILDVAARNCLPRVPRCEPCPLMRRCNYAIATHVSRKEKT